MDTSKDFKLISGTFQEDDARDILNHFFLEKIKLHTNRLFSLQERFGNSCEYSEKRIIELKKDREEILNLIDTARLLGKNIRINSDIQIQLVEEEPTLKSNDVLQHNLK